MTLDDFLRSEEWQKGGVPICQWPGVIWKAAQAAERERIKQIVRDVTEGRSNCNLLLERIDR